MFKINNEEVAGLPITNVIAENQEQYITVPCNFEDGIAAMEFELSDKDIDNIVKYRKIFLFRVLGNAKMQPFYIAADKEEFLEALEYNRDLVTNRTEETKIMKYLNWENIKINKQYVDEVYGIITVYDKAIIKNEKLLVITYKNVDKFPVNFDGMKIFKRYDR